MKARKVIIDGLTITAAAAVGIILSPDVLLATTGTDLDAKSTTAATIIQGVGGFMVLAGIGLTGILWPVYKLNALWGATPSIAGGTMTANATNIAGLFQGGAAFDWTYLTTGSF